MFKNVDINSATYLEPIFKNQERDSNPSCIVVGLDNNLIYYEDTNHQLVSQCVIRFHIVTLLF